MAKEDKKDYYAFCDADTMEIAQKTYVIEFLENKDNGKLYKKLELLAFDVYKAFSKHGDKFNLEKLSKALSLALAEVPPDDLKEKFVEHCVSNHSKCSAKEGLKAMGYVIVGMIQDSHVFKEEQDKDVEQS